MGEIQNRPFQPSFNSSLKVDFQGSRVTSDAGLLVVRELDERHGMSELISDNLTDARRGRNTQLPLPDMLRQSIYTYKSFLVVIPVGNLPIPYRAQIGEAGISPGLSSHPLLESRTFTHALPNWCRSIASRTAKNAGTGWQLASNGSGR